MEIMKCYGGLNRVNSEKKLSQFFLISEKTNGENKMAKNFLEKTVRFNIQRKPALADSLLPYKIYINGQYVGALKKRQDHFSRSSEG